MMLVLALTLCMLLSGSPIHRETMAQAPALIVTIRDATGRGIAGAHVDVRRTDGETIAQATTDGAGEALFPTLPPGPLRVMVSGRLDALTLRHTGQDATGILLIGDAPTRVLDLLVEPDGLVVPDPATMITPDQVGPPVASTADEASPLAVVPSVVSTSEPGAMSPANGAGETAVVGAAVSPAPESSLPLPVLALFLIGALLGLVVLAWRCGRAA